jgi:hypothetical protein
MAQTCLDFSVGEPLVTRNALQAFPDELERSITDPESG